MALTQAQIDERKAILRRFRELLEAQRNKFREYLNVLEKQSHKIEEENAEAILAHTELEQNIVGSIATLQKVIKPIETMYRDIGADIPGRITDAAESAIPALQADLEALQRQVLERNEENRRLLETRLEQIRRQLNEFKNPYRNLKSVFAADDGQSASYIQIDV